jgi:hypothetical protein
MLYDFKHEKARPGARSTCHCCHGPLVARRSFSCDWHWTHARGKDCDPWHEREADWHLAWKEFFEENIPGIDVEKRIEKDGECHVADIHHGGRVIELRRAPIAFDKLQARTRFFGETRWLFHEKRRMELEGTIIESLYELKRARRNLFKMKDLVPFYLDPGLKFYRITETWKTLLTSAVDDDLAVEITYVYARELARAEQIAEFKAFFFQQL